MNRRKKNNVKSSHAHSRLSPAGSPESYLESGRAEKHFKTHVVRIGNSKGIRIPQNFLRESQLGYEVELEARPGVLIVRSSNGPRAGWEEAFDRMAANGDDELLDNGGPETEWERKHWKW